MTKSKPNFLYLLFFLSGFPALIYQIIWQRALFAIYGTNIQAITIIVAIFLFGLGVGALAGGALTRLRSLHLLGLFGCIYPKRISFRC